MEQKNPANQLMLSKYPIIYIQGFSTIQTVVGEWDFWSINST